LKPLDEPGALETLKQLARLSETFVISDQAHHLPHEGVLRERIRPMVGYMNLEEQVDADFSAERRYSDGSVPNCEEIPLGIGCCASTISERSLGLSGGSIEASGRYRFGR
jgi:hypothetical protein